MELSRQNVKFVDAQVFEKEDGTIGGSLEYQIIVDYKDKKTGDNKQFKKIEKTYFNNMGKEELQEILKYQMGDDITIALNLV